MARRGRPSVSVLTPVHNVELSLFREAYQSLLDQSWGFDSLEWVVAVHNMDDGYAAALRDLVGDRANVVFLRVNEGSSVSVPRNRTLDRAAGDYLFFLDGDDRMAPDCVRTVVETMERTGADTAVFNYASFCEEGVVDPGRYIFNAPDRDLVLYDRGDPRITSLMAGCGAELWCRCYRRDVVDRAGVRFDESVLVGETFRFDLSVTPYAQRVCALPRFVGYHYRLRPGSLIQRALQGPSSEQIFYDYLQFFQQAGATEQLWLQLGWILKNALLGKTPSAALDFLRAAVMPLAGGLRVMAPRLALDRTRLEALFRFCAPVLPQDPAVTSPRLRQRYEILSGLLLEEEVLERVESAARENVELRTVGTESADLPFLGVEDPAARPQVHRIDLRSMHAGRREAHMDSYRRVERLRGFRNGEEVPCRVTVFRLEALTCALSLTWDDRFLGDEGAARLWNRLTGELSVYAPDPPNLREMLRRQAVLRPEQRLFRYRAGAELSAVTRQELEDQMHALGAALYGRGLRNKTVALVGRNSYPWVLVYLTLLGGRTTAVTLDPSLPPAELGRRLDRAGAAAAFLDEDVPPPEGAEPCQCFRLSDLPALLEEGKARLRLGRRAWRGETLPPDRPAVILFTSGTTGYGKAAVLTQANLMASARASGCSEWYERCAVNLPLYHIGAQHALLSYLYMGSEILLSSGEPAALVRDCQDFRPQYLDLAPRLTEVLWSLLCGLEEGAARARLGGAVKAVYMGSAPLPESACAGLASLGIFTGNLYGLTETVGAVTRTDHRDPAGGGAMVPLPGTELRVDEAGEIRIRSPMVFAGYLGDPEATAGVLEDGWFRTGDLGRLDAKGRLTVTGRLKNLILFSNGENVSPEEVEARLDGLDCVEECLVFGDAGEVIAARIYPSRALRDLGLKEPELARRLRQEVETVNRDLPPYMRVERVYVSSAPLERNHMGKLKRVPTRF